MPDENVDHAIASLLPARTGSEQDTRRLGARIGRALTPGTTLALYGPVGSGKTQFVKGVCSALGIEEGRVSSPTFTIVHEYRAELPVYHLDLYRLESATEAVSMGLDEYFTREGVCLIEWPDILEPYLPDASIRILFGHAGGDTRSISIKPPEST